MRDGAPFFVYFNHSLMHMPVISLWRGSPGYWEGSYFAGGEGNLRTPCMVRWPGRIQPGRTGDEIVHVTDWFTTILHAAGLSEPDDRVIDGVNELGWLTGQAAASQREGYRAVPLTCR